MDSITLTITSGLFFQICRSISVNPLKLPQFFQPSLFFPHQMKPFQKPHALHQDRFCQKRMKYQNGHKSDTEDIQHQPQIRKHRQDSFQIFVKKSSSENRDPNTDHHKHQLIGNRHDHQDHRWIPEWKSSLFSYSRSDGLSPLADGVITAEKILQTKTESRFFFQMDPAGTHHIPDK